MDSLVMKYAPKRIEETLIPQKYKDIFSKDVKNLNHYIFYGTPGLGKTVLSRAIAYTHNLDVMELNARLDGKVEILNTRMKQFCSSMSLDNNQKIKLVILDEVDGASLDFFEAFKPFVEKFTPTTRFIMITNNLHKLDNAILSRFEKVNFNEFYEGDGKKEVGILYARRIKMICEQENINLDMDAMKSLLSEYFPDFRQCLTILQSLKLKFDNKQIQKSDIKKGLSTFTDLYDMILKGASDDVIFNNVNKNFKDVIDDVFSSMGNSFLTYLKMENEAKYANSLGQCIVVIAKYQYESKFAIDKSVTLLACIYELKKILK